MAHQVGHDSEARTQLGNVLSVLPKKLNKFNPPAGYDFSSEIPIMENLFGISDADMSYVSVKDSLGALSWQAVGGDDGTGIKKFDSPVGYDFKSETPSAKNLIGVSDDGLSYLSVETAGGGAGGAQVPVGPTTFDMDLGSAGTSNWGGGVASFTYQGLDSNGYPYWEEDSDSSFKVEWFTDFAASPNGNAPFSGMWGYVLTYNGTLSGDNTYGHDYIAYGFPSPVLPAGEFWDFRNSSFTYTSAAGNDTSVTLETSTMFGSSASPHNFNGTETAGSGGGGPSLTWQAIGGGGGFGEGASKGGPIFVTGAYSSAGAVAREGDLQHEAVWTGRSTPEDSVEVSLLIERGDSQQYKPTGVYYYQTGQSSEFPNESSPQYLSPDLLTLSDNGYSWEVDAEIPTSDSVMINDTAYYLFFNGERSTEVEIKRSTLPTVSNAVFVEQANNSPYPLIGAVGAGITTPDGTTNFDQMQQSAVKNGDTVRIMLECDKPLSSVLFSSSNGIILDTEFVLPPLVNGESGWPYQARGFGAGIWTIVFEVAVNNVNSIDSNGTFEIKVKDLQGNLSEFWHGSNNVIAIDNSSPIFSLTLNSLLSSAEAISSDPGDPATYDVIGPDLTNEDFFQFDLTDSSEAELHSSHAWVSEQILSDGTIIEIGAASTSSDELSLSPFSIKVLRLTNGTLFESGPSPSVMIQSGADPTFSVNVDAVRSGPGAGYEDEVTITSNVSLLDLSDTGAADVFGDGTVTSGSSSVTKVDAKNWKIKIKSLDSASREVSFDVAITWEKYSSYSGSSTVSSQVRGFVQREISKNGVEALSEIPIGVTVVNSAKIKSKSGLMESLTLKVNSGNEANVPFNSSVSTSSLGGGVGAEFGLSADSSSVILDSDARAQWSPTIGSTVYITLEELI